jgi:hypothetical protein
MTTQVIVVMSCGYAVALAAVIYFTRATTRRVMGVLAGGATVGLMAVGAIALGEYEGWWRIPSDSTPYFWPLMYLGLAISCSPIYLVTWRTVRRFGGRGLAVFIVLVAVIGPPRDYLYTMVFPAWMTFATGIAPILADAVTYVLIVILGHAVMRLVAGPSGEDRLARRPSPNPSVTN